MKSRLIPLVMAGVAVIVLAARAQPPWEAHEGIVVAAGGGVLAMTDLNRQNLRSHNVSIRARIVLDGATAKLEELQAGDYVIVTTKRANRNSNVVIRVDARSQP